MYDSYFRRLWNNESGCLDIYEEGFEEAYEVLNVDEKRTPRLILLSEFLDQNKRKEDEIAFYEKELKKIEENFIGYVEKKDLTETIINIISQEKVVDIKEEMEKKLLSDKAEE